jgi:multidrug efflux pump subunit AcrA (membrane-fusion protein)
MGYTAASLVTALCLFLLAACDRPSPGSVQAGSPPPVPATAATRHEVRVTGVIQAVRAVRVTVPIIQGQFSTMTLTQLIPNGSHVAEGELVAAFDPTQQMDAARDAQAKFEDLSHQVDQKVAENRVSAESRATDLQQAEADLGKAQLELTKRTVLAAIVAEENDATAAAATIHLASLQKSQAGREKSDAAALRILELQRDRQKVNMQRAQDNIQKLAIHAPLSGMVVHDLTYRAGSYGHAQIGDQMNRSYPLLSIFDPSEMQVRCAVNEAHPHRLPSYHEPGGIYPAPQILAGA